MKKWSILTKIEDSGIVAVVRAKNKEEALRIAKACYAGGVSAIEITYTVPNASDVIAALRDEMGDNMVIGAGTVLDAETARIAIMAGAQFVVSPSFHTEAAKLCNRYQVPYMPGCMTVTEMVTAMEHGVDIVKLFPASHFTPDFIQAVKGPLPHVQIMPTGGVDIDNIEAWVKGGAVAIGVGGGLTKGSTENMTKIAVELVQKMKRAREEVAK